MARSMPFVPVRVMATPHPVAEVEVKRAVRIAAGLCSAVECYPQVTLIVAVWHGNDGWPAPESAVGELHETDPQELDFFW